MVDDDWTDSLVITCYCLNCLLTCSFVFIFGRKWWEIFVFVLVSAEREIPFSALVSFSAEIVKSIFGWTLESTSVVHDIASTANDLAVLSCQSTKLSNTLKAVQMQQDASAALFVTAVSDKSFVQITCFEVHTQQYWMHTAVTGAVSTYSCDGLRNKSKWVCQSYWTR